MPDHIVDVIIKISVVIIVDAYTFAVANVGIQFVRFSFLKIGEPSEIQDVIGCIILAHYRDLTSQFLMDIGYFGTLPEPFYVETALVTEQHIVGLVRVLVIGDQQVPRHIVAA